MLFLLMLSSVLPIASAAVMADAPTVRESKNGEFIADHYPPGAYQRGEQGKVAFRLTIEPDGSLGACDVTASSGFAALDQETCEVILRYAQFKPVRNSDGRAVRAVQSGFIVWKLPRGATNVASANATIMPKPNKIICRSAPTTGSLIQRTKQCMTARQWAESNRINRDQIDRLQGRGHFEDENPK